MKFETLRFEEKRIAVEQGLMPFFDGERLLLALQIWEERYSNEPIFGLTRFVNELCDSTALQAQRGKVLQALIQTLLSSSSPDHAPQLDAAPPVRVAHSSHVPQHDATWTCMLLVDTLMRGLSQEKSDGVRLYMLNNLGDLRQPEAAQTALRAWLNQQQNTISVSIAESVLTRIVNLAYVALCEYEGPIKADHMLHNAVLTIERMATESSFPVRRLL
ncbi:MAG: hypothetical protein KDJ22_16020 [Candidatus Competibacteraceae bacterium]|nr:hypothetical protein [Candidatus Competibacteraceae bacterium]MCB1793916.1 hypothetical protein [Candidatus Competibacteraceae bacterium]HPE73032.1 hypothetical protein [Candidatus Competibacter sp.]HRW67098.1 hypothetical protein [Candidatus Competibacter sp.]